jgi:hypothetical protein
VPRTRLRPERRQRRQKPTAGAPQSRLATTPPPVSRRHRHPGRLQWVAGGFPWWHKRSLTHRLLRELKDTLCSRGLYVTNLMGTTLFNVRMPTKSRLIIAFRDAHLAIHKCLSPADFLAPCNLPWQFAPLHELTCFSSVIACLPSSCLNLELVLAGDC